MYVLYWRNVFNIRGAVYVELKNIQSRVPRETSCAGDSFRLFLIFWTAAKKYCTLVSPKIIVLALIDDCVYQWWWRQLEIEVGKLLGWWRLAWRSILDNFTWSKLHTVLTHWLHLWTTCHCADYYTVHPYTVNKSVCSAPSWITLWFLLHQDCHIKCM